MEAQLVLAWQLLRVMGTIAQTKDRKKLACLIPSKRIQMMTRPRARLSGTETRSLILRMLTGA